MDQIHGAAPHTGTCEGMETVHRSSGGWECLRLAWLLEKILEELHPELISDGKKDLF